MKDKPILKPENERKYVLKSLPNLHWHRIYFIEQFYVPMSDGKVHRIRFNYDLHGCDGSFGKLKDIEYIYKENIGPGQNMEHHYTLTSAEAEKLKAEATHRIQKTRHVFGYGKHKFEVDKYSDVSLIMMEVELDDINQLVIMPDAITEKIVADVTELPGNPFSNYKLATRYKHG